MSSYSFRLWSIIGEPNSIKAGAEGKNPECMPDGYFTQHYLRQKNSFHSQRRVAGTTEDVACFLAGRLISAQLVFFYSYGHYIGRDAARSKMDHPTSINNQDNPDIYTLRPI